MNRSTRRSWLLGTLASCTFGTRSILADGSIDEIRARGKKTGMEFFDESESTHYRGIGDAKPKFRDEALMICEAVATDYFKHFTDKGFDLAWPKEKLVVVILMGPKSYARFEGGFVDQAIGGHFDLEANRLVTFDSRGPGSNPKSPISEVVNTFQLVHETIHQLTFNTGVLDLKADVPLCVSEGLATYAETWGPKHRGVIGEKNKQRILGLKQGLKADGEWIPLPKLLTDDKAFEDEKKAQIAYAESWMFVYKMIKEPARLPKFRAYLSSLREKSDPARRIEIASKFLGDLDALDKALHSSLKSL